MDRKEKEFLKRLRATFKVEAEEHLGNMSSELLSLENSKDVSTATASVEVVYRAAHSLKGAARAVGLRDVESVCQSLESVLSLLKNHEIQPSQRFFDVVLRTVDVLNQLINEEETIPTTDIVRELASVAQEREFQAEGLGDQARPTLFEETSSPKPEVAIPVREVEKGSVPVDNLVSDQSPQTCSEPPPASPVMPKRIPQADTVRISITRLDALLYQVEEMVSIKMASTDRVGELRNLGLLMESWEKTWARLRGDLRKLQQTGQADHESVSGLEVGRLFDFLVRHEVFLKEALSRIGRLTRTAENESRVLNGMIDELMDDMKTLLMLPFATVLEPFPKLVRDISRDQGKEVTLIVEGQDVEIDRRILEEMKDPLIHLVRNSLDHGIEKPDVRARLGKPTNANLKIQISQQSSNRIEIVVSDDGAGIDVERVKKTSVARRILTEKEAQSLTDEEALSLIFRSEVSTSDIITDLSGRGLGLAIVQEKVDKLGGHILVQSTPLVGTSFLISLPLTLATFRGILAECGEQLFVIPTSNVQRVVRIKTETIRKVENRETIVLNGRVLLFVWLTDVLEISSEQSDRNEKELISAVILSAGQRSVAFGLDRIVSEQEVIVKGLGKQLARVRNIAGATVLSSGEVVPILNVSDLVKSALTKSKSSSRAMGKVQEKTKKNSRVLIAEDSITSRTLLKNILESAGYEVQAVVDGSEAWNALRTQDFDLLVSDVQMPKLDGFELTGKIRSDKKLAELPVVLVTSLESVEDREKGIDAGASAYIVKSSFDQSNLLDVVSRLL
jgi:two-component system chemotaxis sensor kinase CheA